MTHDAREERAIDLSVLRAGRADPVGSPERWAALVGRIEAAAAPELGRRAELASIRLAGPWLFESVASAVARFAGPALIAAAAAIIAAVGVSRQSEPAAAPEMVATQLLSEDTPSWVAEQRELTVDDLARAIDPGSGGEE